jgi:tetratricopeptide (TPR) repeat protein
VPLATVQAMRCHGSNNQMVTWDTNDPGTRKRIQEILAAGLTDADYAARLVALGEDISEHQGALALNLLREACLLASRAGDEPLICNARIKYAWQNYIAGAINQALLHATYAHAFATRLGDIVMQARANYVIGIVHAHVGNDSEAERLLRDVLTTAQLLDDAQLEALATDVIATLYLDRNRYADALAMKVRAHTLLTALNDDRATTVANNIASALNKLDRRDEAQQWITRALDACPVDRQVSRALFTLTQSEILRSSDDAAERSRAIAALRNALRTLGAAAEPGSLVEAMVRLALGRALFDEGNRAEGIAQMEQSLEFAKRSSDVNCLTKAHHALYESYASIGAYREALAHRNAHAALEAARSERREHAIVGVLNAQRVINDQLHIWRDNPLTGAPPL